MKKILMIAGSALVVSSAFAAVPVKRLAAAETFEVSKVEKVAEPKVATKASMSSKALKASKYRLQNQILADEVTAEEEGTQTSAKVPGAFYMNPGWNAMYCGLTPDGVTFPFYTGSQADPFFVNAAICGTKGYIPFYNPFASTEASYEWLYEHDDLTSNEAAIEETSTNAHLSIPIDGLFQVFTAPTVKETKGGVTEEYTNPYVTEYISAPTLGSVGFAPSEIYNNFPEEYADYYGLQTCPINIRQGKMTYTMEYGKDLAPADRYKDYYSENGTCAFFSQLMSQIYSKYDISNVELSEFIAIIPQQNQPALLDEVWFDCYYQSTADVTLKVEVYPIDEEGYVLRDKMLGSGEVVLPAHDKLSDESPYIALESVDEDGFPTEYPLIISSDVFVCISGFDAPEMTKFYMFYNAGTEIPTYENDEASIDDYFATNAYVNFTFNAKPAGAADTETVKASRALPCSLLNYGGEGEPTEWYATDMSIYFGMAYPYVVNENLGSELLVDVPVAGGTVEYRIESSYSIEQLMQEGLMTAESGADWFKFEVVDADDGQYEFNQLTVTADALPEGVPGRIAVIKLSGFAQDCEITVAQGDLSGISNVAATTGKVELFDLQGRKLNAVPANGIYLERNGNVTTKRIARN